MKHQLIYPMAAYAFYLWGLAIFMFLSRVRSVKSGETNHKYFRVYTGTPPPDRILLIGQHYDNQFQVPMLFFATGATFLAIGFVNTTTLVLAWAFVLSRFAHAWVHLGSNHVLRRAGTFGIGWGALGLLWTQLLYIALVSGGM